MPTLTIQGDISGRVVNKINDGDIHVTGKIDAGSYVTLVSNHGSIIIDGKIDGGSSASLTAASDIRIGVVGADGDKKIDGNSHVTARAGGLIALGNKIDSAGATVDFRACGNIAIGNKIDGGARVRLATGSGAITVQDKVDHGTTVVQYWPNGRLTVRGGVQGGANVSAVDWLPGSDPWCASGPTVQGHWSQNWPRSFGYVTGDRVTPRSVADIVQAITSATPGQVVKAVGGGWSFSDAALPLLTQNDVDRISILKAGASGTEDLSHVLQGLNGATASPMDLQPEAVAGDASFSTHYDQGSLTQVTTSGVNLPGVNGSRTIDLAGLASSLQQQLPSILSPAAKAAIATGRYFFHVEAGITMADLDLVLDHQSPRLAIQASGGSPGATLAGTLSTATHGGEFNWPLLVDRVCAIHLVGPGGEQWWIEGNQSIADLPALQAIYPQIDGAHFVGGAWNAAAGLTAQDVLNAVVVSMGTMGVVYSVVLEVVPQYGIQQIVATSTWNDLLTAAGTSEAALRQNDPVANQAVVTAILDGQMNGTGIGRAENVYADLAINPFNQDCWITNRRVTPHLPIDPNRSSAGFGDYLSSLSTSLSSHAVDTVESSKFMGRIFDFLGFATDVPSINLSDDINDVNQAAQVAEFVARYPDVTVSGLATLNVQAVANAINASSRPDRGQQFLADLLSGILNTLQGTGPSPNSTPNTTDIAYRVGAIGWPDGGIPGRGLEIALAPDKAFSFLQTVVFDDVLANTMTGNNKPLIGYISIRICPQTATLLGMQQFSPFSVMIEVVGYRSPESNVVMDLIQQRVLAANRAASPLAAILHWGLENDQVTANDLTLMPFGEPLRPGSPLTRVDAFRAVRKYLANGNTLCFDNNFTRRLGL